MQIRSERDGDEAAIAALTVAAFRPMPHSDGTEAKIIDRLRADGDLTLSLVATDRGAVVGHIAFSPVSIDGAEGWFGLGPVAVSPDRQREGIGSLLVKQGLAGIAERGANGCALIGDPEFYSRFGFVSDGSLVYRDLPSKYVQWITFAEAKPGGTLKFSDAFG